MSVIDKDIDVAARWSTAERIHALKRIVGKKSIEKVLALAVSAATLLAVAALVRGLVHDRYGVVLQGFLSASLSPAQPFPPARRARPLDFVRSAEERRRRPAAATGRGRDRTVGASGYASDELGRLATGARWESSSMANRSTSRWSPRAGSGITSSIPTRRRSRRRRSKRGQSGSAYGAGTLRGRLGNGGPHSDQPQPQRKASQLQRRIGPLGRHQSQQPAPKRRPPVQRSIGSTRRATSATTRAAATSTKRRPGGSAAPTRAKRAEFAAVDPSSMRWVGTGGKSRGR